MHRLLSFCLLSFISASSLHAQTFRNPYRIPTATDPSNVIVADFNGDGLPDIVYSDSVFAGSLHILLAKPGGGYAAPVSTPTLPANTSTLCRALDTNRDGKPDLVCAFAQGLNASLITLTSNGDGTFTIGKSSPLPAATGNNFAPSLYPPLDFDGDGIPDLIVLDAGNQKTYTMLGDGLGGFTVSGIINGNDGTPVAVDLNGDGVLDLAFSGTTSSSGQGGPTVFLGKGGGSFITPGMRYGDGTCTFADVDGDGHTDAICGQIINPPAGTTHLIILRGNPDGSFNPTPIYDKPFGNNDTPFDGLGSFQFPIAVSDLNGDGIPDIIAYAGNGFTVLLSQSGPPNPTFGDPKHYVAGPANLPGAFTQQIIDINNDGHLDIVTVGANGIYISYGNPDGSFNTAPAYEAAQVLGHATFADFNNDGIPDIAATGDTQIQISLGNGDVNGTFAAHQSVPNGGVSFTLPGSPAASSIFHGDFNGDGNQDLIALGFPSPTQGAPYVYFGNGDGSFRSPLQVPNPSPLLPGAVVADLNGDHRDDLLNNLTILSPNSNTSAIYSSLSNGDDSFQTVVTPIPVETASNGTATGYTDPVLTDFNHDGNLDVVLSAIANAYVFKGHGDGSFDTKGTALPIPSLAGMNNATSIVTATGDFDGDGNQDIAVLYSFSSATAPSPFATGVFIYSGNGDGTFSSPNLAGLFSHHYLRISAADLNGDGRDDLILRGDNTPFEGPALAVVQSLPGRSFGPELNYLANSGLSDLAALDVNRDGYRDILATNGVGSPYSITIASTVAVLLNLNQPPALTGSLTASPEPSVIGQPFSLTATLVPTPTATLTGNVQFTIDGAAAGSAPLVSNAATIAAPTLAIGSHLVSATWPGDGTGAYPAVTLYALHTVTAIPVTLTLTSSPNPANIGQSVIIHSSLTNASGVPTSAPAPTGTITFADNGVTFATTDQASFDASHIFTTTGPHTVTATYSGDATHAPASATLIETITTLPTITTLQSSLNPSSAGQSVTFTTTVTAQPENSLSNLFQSSTVTLTGLPGGPVTLPVPSASSGNIGIVTYATSALPPGTYTITASFSGNTNLSPSTSTPLTQIVTSALTITTLTASPNPAYVTQPVTFTATVNSPFGTPTGTIQFLDGTVPLATVPLTSGIATFTTALLTPGTHSITALYSGDIVHNPSTSSPFTETILSADFTLSIDPSSLTLVTGHHTTLILTATSAGSFADTIHLTLGPLPQWTTVTFTPADLTLSSGGKATSRVYLDTDAVIGYISQSQPRPNLATPLAASTAAALAFILLPFARRSRRLPTLIALTIAAAIAIGATGCSGMYPGSTAPGTYNIQITATGTQTPITHTLTLPLIVTK